MMGDGRLVIDWMPESGAKYGQGWAVIAVDVFRATTTACTAVAAGHRCVPVSTVEEARARAQQLDDPLLAGELHGEPIEGFQMGNSPAAVAALAGNRSIVLLSTSGTQLVRASSGAELCFLGCLRNATATAKVVGDLGLPVAIIGAGTRGEKRLEDRIGCARIGRVLVDFGFVTDPITLTEIEQWGTAPAAECAASPSATFLRDHGHCDDLDFVVSHDDDLYSAFFLSGTEVVEYTP